jgi:hypothetical protein
MQSNGRRETGVKVRMKDRTDRLNGVQKARVGTRGGVGCLVRLPRRDRSPIRTLEVTHGPHNLPCPLLHQDEIWLMTEQLCDELVALLGGGLCAGEFHDGRAIQPVLHYVEERSPL